MRTSGVSVLAILLALASHEVSAQDDDNEFPHMAGDEGEPDEGEDSPVSVMDLFNMHGKVDTDQSGKITRSELMAYFHKAHKEGRPADEALEEMEHIDSNHNGAIDFSEISTAYYGDMEDGAEKEHRIHEDKLKYTAADADESGELNFDEFMSYHHPDERVLAIEAKLRHAEKDHNKDGTLSYHEFEELLHEIEGNATNAANESSEVPGAFTFLDVDGNGQITLEEYIPWELGHFDNDKAITRLLEVADLNGDHELEVEELMAIEKDIAHHHEEHQAIAELVEFTRAQVEQEKAANEHKNDPKPSNSDEL